MTERIPTSSLKISTAWIEVEVVSEPKVVFAARGYAPIVEVKVLQSGLIKILYISAKSLSMSLEKFRLSNSDMLSGLRLKIRKESEDQMSAYVVERLP